jgi:PAS domain S-box-containing protein
LLAGVIAASPDCVNVLSSDGTIEFMNARGLQLNEVDSENDVRGKGFADLWPLDEQAKVRSAIQGAADGRITQCEGYCPSAKGTPHWWDVRFAPVIVADGEPLRIVGVSREVSDRHLANLEARSNEDRFSLLLESSDDGIYGMASDGICTFINSAGASLLGYRREELLGLSLHEIVHHHRADGSAYPLIECQIYKAARSGNAAIVDDEVFWHKDGHPIPVTYAVFPMILDGRQLGTVVTFSDSTERRRVENDLRRFAAELSEADRRKTEFLATLAHELRNPLAPLRNCLDLLSKAGDTPAAIAKVRDMMQRQLGQMVHLVNDLLDIARISSGKMELKAELIDLRRIATIALEASESAIKAGGHNLEVQLPTAAVRLDADVTRLTQAISNILDNAAKYTPPRGRITLLVSSTKTDAQIQISDTGIGIERASLPAVFEMFTQVGRERHAATGGLGIGLNLVRRIVELHGGSVTAQSPGIGQGSTFTIRLPLARIQTVKPLTNAAKAPRSQEKGLRIMIVDDNSDAAASMAMLLSQEKHTTLTANSGAEALQVVAEFNPNIVFLDIGMPMMNGYEVARKLRAMPGLESLILVALTGWGGENDVKRSRDAGFDEHLTKPVDCDTVERLMLRFRNH